MLHGVLALLERSLRVDARAWAPHLARFGLMTAIYIAVCYASATSVRFGAPGLRFFTSIAYLNLTFMTLLGIGYFSTAITEEKEEDSLGLMLMAGISPLGILMGKSGGRLIQALLLIAVQYPFTLLAVTLGGVTQDQVWSTYMGLLAYLIMLAGVGMLCSTLSPNNRSASFRTILIMLTYWLVPLLCNRILLFIGGGVPYFSKFFAFIAESCIFIQMSNILASGFRQALLSTQVLTNSSIGALCFALSWALFRLSVRNPATEAHTRRLLTRNQGMFRWSSPGRPWTNPLVWKDFYFVSGGIAAILMRFGFFALLLFVANLMASGLFGGISANVPQLETSLFLTLSMFAVALDAGLVVSRSLHEEVRHQTLSTLLLLPISTGRILYGKIAGALLGWLPSLLCLVLGIIVLPFGRQSVRDFFRQEGAAFWLIAHLLLVPHLAAVLAMFVRWGAFPLALAGAFGSLFLSVTFFEATRAGHNDPVVWMVIFGVLSICVSCHVVILLKAESLCSR